MLAVLEIQRQPHAQVPSAEISGGSRSLTSSGLFFLPRQPFGLQQCSGLANRPIKPGAIDFNLVAFGHASASTEEQSCAVGPLSALCSANEVAVVIEAGPEAESFVNANGSDRTKSSGAVECFRTWRSTARFRSTRVVGLTTSLEGRCSDRRKRVA